MDEEIDDQEERRQHYEPRRGAVFSNTCVTSKNCWKNRQGKQQQLVTKAYDKRLAGATMSF